jgi:AcrR family transcriptional regulator
MERILVKEVDKTKTIDKILAAAEKEIALRGIDRATIECIAQEAGVTKQLVYHYFSSKDQLYSAILESVSHKIQLFSDIDAYKTYTPENAVRHLVDTIINGYLDNPSYAKFTLDQALHEGEHITQSSGFIPGIRIFIAEVFAPVLRRGSKSGLFKIGLDAEITFWMIFNLAVSCFLNEELMSRASGQDFRSRQNIEKWRNATSQFILDALRG